jgi:hypothetical protein
MRKTFPAALAALTIVAGCASRLSDEAAGIRVVPNEPAALRGCKTVGSMAARSRPVFLESGGRADALAQMLEAAARMDADTVTITSESEDKNVVTLRGVAYQCR